MLFSRFKLNFYFLHIPKTAGSSVSRWIAERIEPHSLCPAKNWDHLMRIKPKDVAHFRAFAGHFGIDLSEFLDQKLSTATVFRDPVARTISHYNHVRRDTNHPYHNYVKFQSFDNFVVDPINRPMIENFQARYLVRSPIDFRKYFKALDKSPGKLSMLSTTSEDSRYLLDDGYVLDEAYRTLKGLGVVGTTEKLGNFFKKLSQKIDFLRRQEGDDIPYDNRAMPGQEIVEIKSSTLNLIRDLTKLDQELYDYIDRKLVV